MKPTRQSMAGAEVLRERRSWSRSASACAHQMMKKIHLVRPRKRGSDFTHHILVLADLVSSCNGIRVKETHPEQEKSRSIRDFSHQRAMNDRSSVKMTVLIPEGPSA